MSEENSTPCACTGVGWNLRPCLEHFGALTEWQKQQVRSRLAISAVGDKRRQR